MKCKRKSNVTFYYSLITLGFSLLPIPVKAEQVSQKVLEPDVEPISEPIQLTTIPKKNLESQKLTEKLPISALKSSSLGSQELLANLQPSSYEQKHLLKNQENSLPPFSSPSVITSQLEDLEIAQTPTNIVIPTAGSQSPATLPQAQPTNSTNSVLAPNEVRILTPQTSTTGLYSTNLKIQYNPQSQIQIQVNENPLDSNTVTQKELDSANNLMTQVWYNIPLKKGKNTLVVRANNGSPAIVQLTVKDAPIQIEISPVGNPRIPADGRSLVTLAGKITNEQGEILPLNTIITLTASAGKFAGVDQDKDQPGFQVIAKDGQFAAQLQSTIQAQKVLVRAAIEPKGVEERNAETQIQRRNLLETEGKNPQLPIPDSLAVIQDIQTYTEIEFITYLRPSLVSGVVDFRIGHRGTNFWGSRSDFLNPDTLGKGTQLNLNGAVFGTGKLGDWLFTGAYNSSRPLNETCDRTTRLFRDLQFCEQNYPVYGDSSTVDYLTPSIDSVYLRFERASRVPGAEPDYIMWGDYNTPELARSSQLFTATTRGLHGFKGNYSLGNLQITALYSKDVQGFQRDTIAPNGTSGYYFLSRRLLLAGSENVFLETEEINRPGTVVERKPLNRGFDYEIDYDRGTLMFRRPILATTFDPFGTTLVRRIVATYQYEGNGADNTSIYAGRLQYNFSQGFNNQSLIGATYLREDQGLQDFELYGADLRLPLGKQGQILAEYGHSRHNSLFLGDVSGSAYRIEVSGNLSPSIQGQAFYRSVDENFANNATISFTPGQTRYGSAIAAQLSPDTSLRASYDHETNFGIAPAIRTEFFDLFNPQPEPRPGSRVDNDLTSLRLGLLQKFGAAQLSVDYVNRSREDRVNKVFEGNASQIVSQLTVPIQDNLAFRAQNELNLNRSDPLYPNRTTLGLDWAVYPGVTVRLAHQFFEGGLFKANSITSLETISEYHLDENTSITSRYGLIGGYNGVTGQGAIGLNHRWVISPGLRVNLGYERIASDLLNPTAAGTPFAQPYAVGQSAASLGLLSGESYSVGVEYTNDPNFQASARVEKHTGSGNNNTVITAAAAGKLSPSLTGLFRYEQANFANQLIQGLGDSATLKLGLAYRNPTNDRFNGLLRYEYRLNPSTIPETLLLGSGTGSNEHLLALEGIYAPNWRWEFYGKYAMRYSTTHLAENFSNSSMVSFMQLRTTYRLNYQMDLGAEVRWITQPDVNYQETGLAIDTGYYLTPDLRAYIGYSFGSVDDRDFTGYRSHGGLYLGVTLKVNELFNGFGRQKPLPSQPQESDQPKIQANREVKD